AIENNTHFARSAAGFRRVMRRKAAAALELQKTSGELLAQRANEKARADCSQHGQLRRDYLLVI
ncbi:MAG: hypothetical protein ACRCWJ_08385, partial [Casimicrobium sp.]